MKSTWIKNCRNELEALVGEKTANFITDADISDIIVEMDGNRLAILKELKETAMYKKIAAGERRIPEIQLHPDCKNLLWRATRKISDEHKTNNGLTALFNNLLAVAGSHIKNEYKK